VYFSRPGDRERGAAAVEFAIVSLLLFMLLFGMLGFGFYLYSRQSAVAAAREGARLAAVGINNCSDWKTIVINRGAGATITAANVTMGRDTSAGSDVNGNNILDPGDGIKVTVTYTPNGPAQQLIKVATSLIPGHAVDVGSTATVSAVSRAESVNLTSC
jgi:Flp pilus assembly protein TadG